MSVEIEKKFLISQNEATWLKKHFHHQTIGIIQWYLDGARYFHKSERIRLILNKDGNEIWIKGKKECIDQNLIYRREEETQIENASIQMDELRILPFIIKLRSVFELPFHAEVVLDHFLDNPYCVYDVNDLLEIELTNNEAPLDETVAAILKFLALHDLNDVSTNFNYANHAIALRSLCVNDTKKNDIVFLTELLKKELRGDNLE